MKLDTIKRLYHGTDREFDAFDFQYAKSFKDFGKGFYLTSNLIQAQKWAQIKAKYKNKAFIYSYGIQSPKRGDLNILELLQYNSEWVDFISRSRIYGYETDYDIIYDRMADNRYVEIADALQLYTDNKITSDSVIDKIK